MIIIRGVGGGGGVVVVVRFVALGSGSSETETVFQASLLVWYGRHPPGNPWFAR